MDYPRNEEEYQRARREVRRWLFWLSVLILILMAAVVYLVIDFYEPIRDLDGLVVATSLLRL